MDLGWIGWSVSGIGLVTFNAGLEWMVSQVNRASAQGENFDSWDFRRSPRLYKRLWKAHRLLLPDRFLSRVVMLSGPILFAIGFAIMLSNSTSAPK
jgi:hypothetical protein